MAKDESQDVGLGLGGFLGGKKTDEAPKQEMEAVAPPDKAEKPDSGKQAEAKAETTKPAGLDKDAEGAAKPKKEAAGKPNEAPASPNWDDDSNPWKAKASEFEKRYKDTHRDWNRVNQERVEAQRQQQEFSRQLEILNKKLDGTYDPARDEAPPPDPMQYRQWGSLEGKVEASLAAAVRVHGQDEVMSALERYAEIFKDNKSVQQEILMSADPIQGALDAIKSHEFFAKYGTSPEMIQKRFEEDFNTNQLPKIREAERKAALEELQKQPREPRGIGGVLGSSGATDKQVSKDNKGRQKSLSSVFGR
jgi:hypothetical protein